MAWFDASDYLSIETAARDRMQDLETVDDAVTDPAAMFTRTDRPRKIDRIIDYFGECPHRALQTIGSA
jgi:hypothetical protein